MRTSADGCACTFSASAGHAGTRSTHRGGVNRRRIRNRGRGGAPIVRPRGDGRDSTPATACRCGITTCCWSTSAAFAPSAGRDPPARSVSITAMSPDRCAVCSAADAISASVSSRTIPPCCRRQSPISTPRALRRPAPSARTCSARCDYPPSSSRRCRKLAISCLLCVRCRSSTSRMRTKPRFLSASTSIPPAADSMPAASQTMSISRSRA